MKVLKIFSLIILFTSISYADWIEEAREKTETELKVLAVDIGKVLGGGFYSPVRGGGLLSFKIGLQVSSTKISEETKNLKIFPEGKESIGLGWIYIGKGIPGGFDIFLRFSKIDVENSSEKISLFGIGIEYKIVKDRLISLFPGLSILIAGNTFDSTYIDIKTKTIALKLSKKLPVITPFFAVARDKTEMEIDSTIGKLKPEGSSTRFLLGIQIRAIPFTYIDLSLSKVKDETGIDLGFGVKF